MKVLIIPQFSMRSHKTGTYSLLADGNLNIVLHHIFNSSKTNEYTITIPDKHAHADLEVLEDKILPMFKCKITILPIKYGLNADDNRTVVPDSINVNFLEYAQVISYFELGYLDPFWMIASVTGFFMGSVVALVVVGLPFLVKRRVKSEDI